MLLLSRRIVRCVVLFLLIFSGATNAQLADDVDAMASFRSGTNHFRAGRFQAAVEAYLQARKAGLDTAKLRFNLASAYYRLGRYSDARREYRSLLGEPEIMALARYNVGLTYLKQNKNRPAIRAFKNVIEVADDRKLKLRAEKALALAKKAATTQLSNAFRPSKSGPRVSGLVEVGGGFEDNVTLAAEAEQIGLTGESDVFGRALAAGQWQIRGTRAEGERLSVAGYVKRYENFDAFDQSAFRLGFTVDRPLGRWTVSPGLDGSLVYLDDERFLTTISLVFKARGPLTGPFGAELGYQASYNDAGSRFESIAGQRHILSGSLLALSRLGKSELGYEFQFNDRRDFESDSGEFFSRSPVYHLLFVGNKSRHFGKRLTVEPRLEYRIGHYKDRERRRGNGLGGVLGNPVPSLPLLGGLLDLDELLNLENLPGSLLLGREQRERRRRDNRLVARLRSQYAFARRFYLQGEYQYTRNTSNFDEFEYERNAVGVGLGAKF